MRLPNLLLSTIILFLSNITVRILGFIYKIFLSNSIGETGLGIYHITFNFLMICLAFTTTGIPTALSCLVAKIKLQMTNIIQMYFLYLHYTLHFLFPYLFLYSYI